MLLINIYIIYINCESEKWEKDLFTFLLRKMTNTHHETTICIFLAVIESASKTQVE